ncbi:MAG: FAD-dependent oxidoreductase [Bacteroidales bacterium]|jgi:glycerol-3-phosphate dehydrogenase
MNRDNLILKMLDHNEKAWDIIVIGGGATGLGVAIDAVTRGYDTLLLEQADFTKATSSRSTKLVHGGVRYLAQGDVLLVTEALHERGWFLKNAPHLTANQEFVIPVYTLWDVILYTVGLKFYDLLSGRLSLGKSYFINRSRTLARLPLLQPNGLKGGIVYHDGQFDDSRMAMTLASSCVDNGGVVLNYFKVVSLLKDENGMIKGVRARDMENGSETDILAKLVINATGIFADDIHRMDDPSSRPTIRPSQGVHVVLDKSFLQSDSAIMIPKTDDGRVLFAIPWYGKVVAGTTDTPLDDISMEPVALDEEINFILKTAGKYLTRQPERKDAFCIFAGLRPLAANPGNPSSTKEVSRRHKITLSGSGLLSIIGGKWTSYRRMAEETLDRGIKAGILPPSKCRTKSFSLCSDEKFMEHGRLKIYGSGASEIKKMIAEKQELGQIINPQLPYTKAEVIWICHNEMPRTVEDILARRTRALFLDARASIAMAPEVADILASEVGFNVKWKEGQLADYKNTAQNYL